MKDRPIIFSGPMVRALLDGRKTQTRRVIDPCKDPEIAPGDILVSWPADAFVRQGARFRPRFAVGDLLWVREAWGWYGGKPNVEEFRNGVPVFYRANDGSNECYGVDWRPSMFMPRWASRLTLTVTDVRVQRLQEITPADAIAEGIAPTANSQTIDCDTANPCNEFRRLWDGINGKRAGCAWADDPWVVALSFSVHKENIDAL